MTKKYEWCKDLPTVNYKDKEGNKYCVFHAPQGKKGISVEEFNELIFEIIIKAKIEGRFCDLSGTIFEGEINFGQFDKSNPFPNVNLSETTFYGEIDFCNVTFSQNLYLSGARFNKRVYFKGASFNKESYFSGTVFKDEVYFGGAIFNSGTDFLSAKFNKLADFSEVNFEEGIHFRATFEENAIFLDSVFRGKANFSLAQFKGITNFVSSIFEKEADFSKAKFGTLTNFTFAKFKEDVEFFETQFSGNIDFIGSIFKQPSYFFKTIFDGKADFSGASFIWVNFNNATFKGEINFFRNTLINAGDFSRLFINEKVIFEGVTLKEVSFIDTDLRKIDFSRCEWPKNDGRDVLYDEIELFKKEKDKYFKEKIKKIEILYRQLKQKNKEEHNEYEASNWHYGEKEMQRKRSGWKNFSFYLLNLYWVSSGYGEDPIRAAVVLFFLIVYASWLLAIAGLTVPYDSINGIDKSIYGITNIIWPYDFDFKKVWALLLNTLKYVTFQRDYFFKPINWFGETVKILTQILIPLQTALFVLAVRNRFRR